MWAAGRDARPWPSIMVLEIALENSTLDSATKPRWLQNVTGRILSASSYKRSNDSSWHTGGEASLSPSSSSTETHQLKMLPFGQSHAHLEIEISFIRGSSVRAQVQQTSEEGSMWIGATHTCPLTHLLIHQCQQWIHSFPNAHVGSGTWQAITNGIIRVKKNQSLHLLGFFSNSKCRYVSRSGTDYQSQLISRSLRATLVKL
jgi:hypothetical protein